MKTSWFSTKSFVSKSLYSSPLLMRPQKASSNRSYTMSPGATIRKFLVNLPLGSSSCRALSICQSSIACITQVLPVPVAIFTAYFGIWYFALASVAKSACAIRSSPTKSYVSVTVFIFATSCRYIIFNIA